MNWIAEYRKSLKMIEVEDFFDLFFFRPLGFLLVKLIYRTEITPNQLTYTSLVLGLIAGILYAKGTPYYFLLGALFFVLYNILDCSDGQLARLKKNGTHAGRIIDGIADYLVTLAVFVGIGIGYGNKQANPGFWWFLILLLIVSSVIQAILVDYYRNRFLDNVLQRKNTFVEDLDSYRDELDALKNQKNKMLDRTIIQIYLKYCAIQDRIIPKGNAEKSLVAYPEVYYNKNKIIMRLWVLICSSSEISALVICSLFNRLDLFFWIILVGFNGFAAILWFVQRRIDQSFKLAA
ncbi:MAG: CDP-alcohol phosphatidyltransferase family protein [Saprospiraceae bacterium]